MLKNDSAPEPRSASEPMTSGPVDPLFEGLDCVPGYLTEYRAGTDLAISTALTNRIQEVDRNHQGWTPETLFTSAKEILAEYAAEKGEASADELSLLAMLFWQVTKRTKAGQSAKRYGKRIPYWGEDTFNYLFILGRAKDPEVSAISWRLTSGQGLPEKMMPSTVVELYRLVKKIAKGRKLSERDVYERVIVLCKEHDTTGRIGLNRIWSPEVQSAILLHFGLKQPPKGSRRNGSKVSEVTPESPAGVSKRKSEPLPTEVPEMAPVKEGRKRKVEVAKPTRPSYPEEQRLAEEIHALVDQLVELRCQGHPSDHHAALQESVSNMIDNAFAYLHARVERLARDQKELNGMASYSSEAKERRLYEEACRSDYFGCDVAPGKLVNYERDIKKAYKQMSFDWHPDRHPEHLEKYLQLQRYNEIIITYNETHKEEVKS